MTNTELLTNVERLTRAKEEVKRLEELIKNEMTDRKVDEVKIENVIIRYKEVITSKFSAKEMKLKLGEAIYKSFCHDTPSMRFSITQ